MSTAIITVLLLATADPPREKKDKELPEATQKELKKLEGKWKVVKFLDSAREIEIGTDKRDLFWTFKGAVVTLEFGYAENETLKIAALDPGTDPKCIDLIEMTKGQPDRTLEGVFKIDGDTLLLALHVSNDSKQRPVGFDKPTDRQTIVWTLKRVKE